MGILTLSINLNCWIWTPKPRHTLTAAVHALPTWLVTAHEASLGGHGLHVLGCIVRLHIRFDVVTDPKQTVTWLSRISRSFRTNCTMDWCKEGWRPESVKKWNRKQWNIWKYGEVREIILYLHRFVVAVIVGCKVLQVVFWGVALGTRQPCRRSMTWTIWDPLMSWAKAREILCVRPLSSMLIIDLDVSWLVMMYHLCHHCHHASFITTFHDLSSCIITCHHLSSLHVALNVLRSLNVERWWHETLRLRVELELNQTCVSSSVSHLFHWNFPEPQSWNPTLGAVLHRRSLPDHVWSSEKVQFLTASCYVAYNILRTIILYLILQIANHSHCNLCVILNTWTV